MTERTLTGKTLAMAVFRRDFKASTVGHLEAVIRVGPKDWNALDDFYKSKGAALIRETYHGINVIKPPEGWDHIPVAMANHFSDGSIEGAFTDEEAQENALALGLPSPPT